MSFLYAIHYTQPLLHIANTQLRVPLAELDLRTQQLYRRIDAVLGPPFTTNSIQEVLTLLQSDVALRAIDQVVLTKVACGLYANALDLYLGQASAAQDDAEWWAAVEQSNRLAAYYLLQTLPKRIWSLLRVLRSSDGSLHLSTFTFSSLRHHFSSGSPSQPNPFMSTLFPHLKRNTSGSLTQFHPVFYVDPQRPATSILRFLYNTVRRVTNRVVFVLYFPLRLSRDECRLKRLELEKVRNDRAEVLGKLIGMRPALMRAMFDKPESGGTSSPDFLIQFITVMSTAVPVELSQQGLLSSFMALSQTILVTRRQEHASYIADRQLRRPSRLIRWWPRIFLLPPLTVYCLKRLYASRATLTDFATDVSKTIHNFVADWLLEPLRGVWRTIRVGGEEGVIIRREAVSADLHSLERMALSLAQDKLGYTGAQLATLSNQIRMGDLTPVLEIYENDIKQPLKSALTGTLLRSLFIQLQKAKVDIDQALTGIDKLLKSQELTFAFVGVAPALAIVYVAGGFLKRLMFGAVREKYGGDYQKRSVWLAMRRIERLLLFQPHRSDEDEDEDDDEPARHTDPVAAAAANAIPPLTTGLLVLSLTHLRHYALVSLPARSQLREGFLEDVQDLEDPTLGRWEKLRVVERMWSSWGRALGWYEVASRVRM